MTLKWSLGTRIGAYVPPVITAPCQRVEQAMVTFALTRPEVPCRMHAAKPAQSVFPPLFAAGLFALGLLFARDVSC